ncbi:MAG: cytochrome C, partial [Candidatus Lambdaproteobacteria bacterium]|nr:cytochrome C [Candidatus Lambdaproteobacteria bacterium]
MDCHNRPAHQYATPMKSVNASIEQGLIPRSLPFIKLESTKALDQEYTDTAEALTGIANHLRNYYKEKYPEILNGRVEDVKAAINEVQEIYKRSIFPEMQANWSKYPDNIGHRDWQGCFRCHNEDMKSKNGFIIFTTCDKCHLILAQGENVDQVASVDFLKGKLFKHPGEDGEEIREYTECVDCHTGGAETYD